MAEEKIVLPEDDDWLNDFQEESDAETLEGLDQSDVDELMAAETGAPKGVASAEDDGDIPVVDLDALDQNQVDDLLGIAGEEEEAPVPKSPDQDEIDTLFDEASKEVKENENQAAAPASKDTFDLDFETIEADDFGFGEEIAEIPDEAALDEESGFLELQAETKKEPLKKTTKRVIPFFTPKNIAIAAGILVLLGVGTFGYMQLSSKKQPPAITLPPPPVAQTKPPPPPNRKPEASAAQYAIKERGGDVLITLAGKDPDGDALTFEVSKTPKYGKLAGDIPSLTYLPDRNFSGNDFFEFTVSDGKDTSSPVAVIITGPDMTGKALARATTTRRPRISAVNVTMKTLSTDDLLVNWENIWRQSNHAPFDEKVKVYIEKQPKHGKLTEFSDSIYHYQPEILFAGKDYIHYRFERGGVKSQSRRIKLLVEPGDTLPEVQLLPLADRVYTPGETVVLDASASKDNMRGSLEFNWQQLAGVPVLFKKLNDEGSVVSFIVPSFFNTIDPANLRLRLTIVDKIEQLATEDVEITIRSRRQAALWRGLKGGGIVPEPACPQGECPGQYLPWPHND